jgi:hypothetical protein
MISFDDFLTQFTDIQVGLMRDYGDEVTKLCRVMHREIGLAQTKADDADELVARLSEQYGDGREIDANDLDFTQEHKLLHGLLDRAQLDAALGGASPSTLLAAMFVIGRRYGMREAAAAFDSLSTDDTSEAQA